MQELGMFQTQAIDNSPNRSQSVVSSGATKICYINHDPMIITHIPQKLQTFKSVLVVEELLDARFFRSNIVTIGFFD